MRGHSRAPITRGSWRRPSKTAESFPTCRPIRCYRSALSSISADRGRVFMLLRDKPAVIGIVPCRLHHSRDIARVLCAVAGVDTDAGAIKRIELLALCCERRVESLTGVLERWVGAKLPQVCEGAAELARAKPGRIFGTGLIVGYRGRIVGKACQPVLVGEPCCDQRRWRGDPDRDE